MESYHACLNLFKKGLTGGSEKGIVAERIAQIVPTNRIRWLDLGIGSGNFCKKVVDILEEKGFSVELTGVDIDKESIRLAKKQLPNGKFIMAGFDNLNLRDKFDVIYASQSLYYARNRPKLVKYLLRHLAEGGLLVIVLWSQRDALYTLHRKVYPCLQNFGAYCAEEAYCLLKGLKNKFFSLDKIDFYGGLNCTKWGNSIKNLRMIERVISRLAVNKLKRISRIELLQEEIKKMKKPSKRVNTILIAKKGYGISNFNRKNLINILRRKFPHYTSKVANFRGDLESLFMGSWEKETRHLSEIIPPGRVLEICCAAGCKSVILAKRHKVIAIDIDKKRINAAKQNAMLFGVDKIKFIEGNALDPSLLRSLGTFSAIYVDADWRENLSHPIKKQNLDPFKTTPRTDKLYGLLRKLYPKLPIVFKVSPFVRVKDMQKLGKCKIEELFINNKFLSYNVYYSPKIKKNQYTKIKL